MKKKEYDSTKKMASNGLFFEGSHRVGKLQVFFFVSPCDQRHVQVLNRFLYYKVAWAISDLLVTYCNDIIILTYGLITKSFIHL